MKEVMTFLEGWKPYSELPPGNLIRRSVTRFVATANNGERKTILAKANTVYKLQRTYDQLGILKAKNNPKAELFDRLLDFSTADFAAAIKAKAPKDHVMLLQEGFEFGRIKVPPGHFAARDFLVYFFGLQAHGTGLKYSIYSNGVLFTTGGQTHDEMAKEFTKQGFGSGQPRGGGTIVRSGELDFDYDTYSKFVQGPDMRADVAESLRRWIRTTGGQDDKINFTYHDNVAQL